MMIDNPYQSPDAESPAKLDDAAGRKKNWTDYSPEYNAAFKTALLIQIVLALLTVPHSGFRTNTSRILGCVPLPLGNGLDHIVPTANAANTVGPLNRALWDRSTTMHCRRCGTVVPAYTWLANLRRDEQTVERERRIASVLRSTVLGRRRVNRSVIRLKACLH